MCYVCAMCAICACSRGPIAFEAVHLAAGALVAYIRGTAYECRPITAIWIGVLVSLWPLVLQAACGPPPFPQDLSQRASGSSPRNCCLDDLWTMFYLTQQKDLEGQGKRRLRQADKGHLRLCSGEDVPEWRAVGKDMKLI